VLCFAFCPQDMKVHSLLLVTAIILLKIPLVQLILITCHCVEQCMYERKYASFV
jgi:hypothetical protein